MKYSAARSHSGLHVPGPRGYRTNQGGRPAPMKPHMASAPTALAALHSETTSCIVE